MTGLERLSGGEAAWTRDFEFVRGEYAIAGERVPYFAVAMTISEALLYLNLADSLAVDPSDPINIEELMQRDINRDRAVNDIAAYLREPARIKFFNALTVVLIPVNPAGRPEFSFPVDVACPADFSTSADFTSVHVGPVIVRQLTGSKAGYVRWRPDTVRAVIIDGQHRFVALKHVHDEMSASVLQPDVTAIPVLLLILDERADFVPPVGGPSEIVKASRAIFTDLNKYAVKVTPEREYLLDDRSLVARCMRSVITSGIGGNSSAMANEWPAKIPLAIVDWTRSSQSKFSDSYYVTTIQSLHQLTSEVLQHLPPNPTAYGPLASWLDSLTARLELTAGGWNLPALMQRLEKSEAQDVPFVLESGDLDAAADGFGASIGQVLTSAILKLKPYAKLLDRYREVGLLGGQQELWLGQSEAGRRAYRVQFPDDPGPSAAAIAEDVKNEYKFAYQVVFQRGFVLAAREIDAFGSHLAEAWGLPDVLRQTVLSEWIKRFNATIPSWLENESLWIGAAINVDRTIDFGQTSKNAIMGLTILLTTKDIEIDDAPGLNTRALRTILGVRGSRRYWLLDSDPLILDSALSDSHLAAAARWEAALSTINPGPAGPPVRGLIRAAAKAYREGIRRYVKQLAVANGIELDEDERDQLVVALGARRLALT